MKKHIKYKFIVDDDVKQKYTILSTSAIEFQLMAYLNDPEGWSKHGYFFEPVPYGGDVLIRLSSPKTITKDCGLPNNLSCAVLGGTKMWLNAERWFHGAPKSKLGLLEYRQYMVSHEIGHIIGHEHTVCRCKGCLAPVMMQQTLGIGECKPNTSV
jgi:hypothetical protein